jgi:putative (di)nucleoside polyphosphate hydrolase
MPLSDLLSKYRPNIGVVLFNSDGRVFMGRRAGDFSDSDHPAGAWRWQFPQGGIDAGETIEEAAARELKEETGIVSARLISVSPGWVAYDFPVEYRGKGWIGQRQKWAAMLFEGEEREIRLDADDHQEFDAWRWAELEEAPTLIVPFKRAVYEDVVAGFAPLRDYLRNR